ncbi:MAG: thioredoxin domain-containing protein [Myxococcales bacterium]|nr:thioredoxin domain-containing protein [Myxococcales bacterium]
MSVEGNPFKGPADAKVTIVKGYEYACFYCEKVRSTMEEIVKKYGADVRIVYKQFVVHPQTATAPALAACAAHKQGRFEQMDKLLWDKVFSSKNFDKDKMTDGQGAQRLTGDPRAADRRRAGRGAQLNIQEVQGGHAGRDTPAGDPA